MTIANTVLNLEDNLFIPMHLIGTIPFVGSFLAITYRPVAAIVCLFAALGTNYFDADKLKQCAFIHFVSGLTEVVPFVKIIIVIGFIVREVLGCIMFDNFNQRNC